MRVYEILLSAHANKSVYSSCLLFSLRCRVRVTWIFEKENKNVVLFCASALVFSSFFEAQFNVCLHALVGTVTRLIRSRLLRSSSLNVPKKHVNSFTFFFLLSPFAIACVYTHRLLYIPFVYIATQQTPLMPRLNFIEMPFSSIHILLVLFSLHLLFINAFLFSFYARGPPYFYMAAYCKVDIVLEDIMEPRIDVDS